MKSRSIIALMLVFVMLFSLGATRVFAAENAETVKETQEDTASNEPADDDPADSSEPSDPEPSDPEPTDPEPTDPEPTDPEPVVDPAISASASVGGKHVVEPLASVNVQVIANLTGLDESETYTLNVRLKTSSGSTVMMDGAAVEKDITVSGKSEGTENATLVFDASDMAGKSVVVIETLYKNGEAVCGPTNASDPNQTISITNPSVSISGGPIEAEKAENALSVNYSGLIPGNPYKITVEVKDASGNVVGSYTGSFTAFAESGTKNISMEIDAENYANETLSASIVLSRAGHVLDSSDADIQVLAASDPVDPPDDPEPTDPKPTDPDPTEPSNPEPTDPTEPSPTEPSPIEPEPTDPKPTKPTDPKPTDHKPTDPVDQTDPTDHHTGNTDGTNNPKDDGKDDVENPNTGDENNLSLWVSVMIFSMFAICVCGAMLGRQMKKRDE